MTAITQGRRPDGPGAYHYEDGVMAFDCLVTRHHDMRRLVALYVGPWNGKRVDRWEPVDDMPGDFLPLTKPVAAPEPDEDREPSWQDYSAVTLHDLAWLREMAEEYEWSHRADPGVDMERVRMVISRMVTALHRRKEVQSE